jgi:hypothetical protein
MRGAQNRRQWTATKKKRCDAPQNHAPQNKGGSVVSCATQTLRTLGQKRKDIRAQRGESLIPWGK